jgi:superfamily I DNA/RNA helicase
MKNIGAAGAFLLVEKNSLNSNEIQSTTIRQFKGLEKPVVILVCPSQDQLNFTELMYVGTSRAINHLELLIRSNAD